MHFHRYKATFLKCFCSTAVLWGCINSAQAQNNNPSFAGVVQDAHSRSPIEGVLVRNQRSGEITATNDLGRFSLSSKFQQTDSLQLSAIGFATKKISVVDAMTVRNILLQPDIAQLKELTLVAGINKPLHQISKLDIKMRGINNTQEVLRIVPGLLIGQHAGGGKAEQIFLRGFDIDHGTDISISADGLPVNMVSHAHGQGYADLHYLIPELIEQVQFGKGPYAATKGNFATAGYVDLQTKDRLGSNSVKVEGGQFNTLRTLAMVQLLKDQNNRGKDLYVAGEYLYSRGFFDAPQNFHRLNLFAKYLQQLNANNQLSVSASTFSSKWNASGQIPERAVASGAISFFGAIDPNEGGNTHRTNVNAILKTQLSQNTLLRNQAYFIAYDFDLFSNFTFFLNDPLNGDRIRQSEKRKILGYNGSYHVASWWGATAVNTEAGLTLRADATSNSQLAHTLNREAVLEQYQLGDIRETNTAGYVQQTIRWSDRFTTNAGLRVDHFANQYRDDLARTKRSKNTAIVSPKINLTYQLHQAMELYVSAGRGFHSNDTRVMVQTTGRKALPGAWGADLGVSAKPAKNLLLHAALWYLSLQQEFVYVGDEGIVEPSGSTVRRGVDVSVRYQPIAKLFLDMDANFCDGSFVNEPKGADYLPLSPRFTSTGGITYKSTVGLNGSIRYRWMGDRPANEEASVVAKGYFVTDAVVAYTKPKWELMLTAQNLLNTRWKETQFETTSRLMQEPSEVTEIHFTPGTPFFLKAGCTLFF
jgi:outer membrane receptor protein involved in Fe transport